MSLFEFELIPVEHIEPWDEGETSSLSWFALTLGTFHMTLGSEHGELFRYSPSVLDEAAGEGPYPTYQIAAFAGDILGAARAGIEPLPTFLEDLLQNESAFWTLESAGQDDASDNDRSYVAWRWLGERSPSTSYLVAHPRLWFVRVADEIWIQWDNRDRMIDGRPMWTATHGKYVLSLATFVAECRAFASRLLQEMDDRLLAIESGTAVPACAVSLPALRAEHETWRAELAAYFEHCEPDFTWSEVEQAIRSLAADHGVVVRTDH